MKKNKIFLIISLTFLMLCLIIFIIYKNEPIIGQNIEENKGEIVPSMVPVIPEGFHSVKVSENDWEEKDGVIQNWDKGLVIEDTNGNQFVWVPCSLDGNGNTIKFARYFYNFENKGIDEYNTTDYIKYDGYRFGEPYLNNITELENSIEKYGGFYIGLFEVGNENNQKKKKKNREAWKNVTYTEANKIANNFFEGDTNNIKTALCNSFVYDTTTAWQHDKFVNCNPYDYINYGNFSGKECLTGEDESLYVKNIADLYGNLFEYTTERCNNRIIQRGLCYNYTKEDIENNDSVEMKYDRLMCYSADDNNFKNELVGFRIYMYLTK